MKIYDIPNLPLDMELETKAVLRQLNLANKQLAELKGVVHSIPNPTMLLNSLALQEARDSSEVENIVTTHDELYESHLNLKGIIETVATKEVKNYNKAMFHGFTLIQKQKLMTSNIIKEIQEKLIVSNAGFRKVPGTSLKNKYGEVIYTPPQDANVIIDLMNNLEKFINDFEMSDLDPLTKTAIIHHQFESIHPFYDGNGRTGRIILILFLVLNELLDYPILYLSRYINQNKSEYYRLLQAVRDEHDKEKVWQEWILFLLKGIELTAKDTIVLVKEIWQLMNIYKPKLKTKFGKVYRHELLNHLFYHPYTKIEYMQDAMNVQRKTASKYLDMIVEEGLLTKVKKGRSYYFINNKLIALLMNVSKN